MMASLKQRLVDLENKGGEGFGGFVVIASWDYPGQGSDEALDSYIAANGPIPANKLTIVIGWGR